MESAPIERLTEILVHTVELTSGLAEDIDASSTPLFEPLLNAIDTAVFVADSNGKLLYVNAAWERLTGFPLAETRAMEQPGYIHPRDLDRWLRFLDARKRHPQRTTVLVLRFLTRSGAIIYLEASAQALIANTGRCQGFVGTLSDVGGRVQEEGLKQASYRTLETLINNFPGLVYRCRNNRQWTMEYMSKGCEALTGYPPEALVNNKRLTYADLIVPEDREDVWKCVQAAIREKRSFEKIYRIRTAQGEIKWVLEHGRGNFSTSGELLGLEGFMTDITREQREQLLRTSEGLYDTSSGLPKPALFLDRLKMSLRYTAFQSRGAVLIVHLDQFEKWRETLDPDLRERALLDVSRRIESVLSPLDSLCLWSRNEFAILHEWSETGSDAATIATKVQQKLRAPISEGKNEFFLTTSIGIATGLTGGRSAEDVLGFASAASSRARNMGIDHVEVADMAASAPA